MILFILDILSWLWKSDFGTFYKKKIPLKGLGDQFLDFYDYIQLKDFALFLHIFYKISNFYAEIQVFEGTFLKLS